MHFRCIHAENALGHAQETRRHTRCSLATGVLVTERRRGGAWAACLSEYTPRSPERNVSFQEI